MTSRGEMLEALDTAIPDATTWTTGNVAEAFPGVFTSFAMSFVFVPMEPAFRDVPRPRRRPGLRGPRTGSGR